MTLVLREINNTGEPLCAPDGTVLAGVAITFTLINPNGLAIDVWDATTYERVAGLHSTTTDINGEFTVDLWPTDRGNAESVYLCHVDSPYVQDFMAPLPSGMLTAISWVAFMGGAIPLPPVPLDALAIHEASPTGHPNATESLNGFMSAADKLKLDNLPGAGSVGLAFQANAGAAISGNSAVVVDNAGLAWYADRATPDNMNRVAGITMNAASIGAQLNIMSRGVMVDGAWSWTPYLPIFLGHTGVLTQTVPADGFTLILGVALNATSIFVNPNQPIVTA